MPKYILICRKCGKNETKFIPASWSYTPCSCGGIMEKQIPTIKRTTTKEKVDVNRNIDWIEDQEKILEDRSKEHFYKHEVKKLVQSGQYSVKEMKENGWIYFDNDGHMQITDTPPNKEPKIDLAPKKKRGRPKKK